MEMQKCIITLAIYKSLWTCILTMNQQGFLENLPKRKENIHPKTYVWEFIILHKTEITQVFFRWSIYKQVVKPSNGVWSEMYDTEQRLRLQVRDSLVAPGGDSTPGCSKRDLFSVTMQLSYFGVYMNLCMCRNSWNCTVREWVLFYIQQ